jgi:hypothetical protein
MSLLIGEVQDFDFVWKLRLVDDDHAPFSSSSATVS